MAVTRHATGHSAPRKSFPFSVTAALLGSKPRKKPTTTTTSTTTTTTKTTKTTGGAARTTANTSKPRAKTAAGGRVEKKNAKTAAGGEGLKRRPRKTGVKDKVQGLLEKAIGTVEGKPGKKGAGTKKIRGTDGKGVAKGR